MSKPDVFVFEVSEGNFNDLVILNSHKLPVVVAFMDMSIGTCIQMERDLTALATELAGQFVFAMVDIDMQPDLTKTYDIQNVPSLKMFKDGEIIHQEVGLMQKDELAALLKTFGIYRQTDDMRAKARELHLNGDTPAAIVLLTEAIQKDPTNTSVAMDMAQVMLDVNLLDQALDLFNRLPNKDKESDTGRALIGQITFKQLAAKTEGKSTLVSKLMSQPDNHDIRFDLAICHVAEHNYLDAMESLFDIFQKDPDYKQGAAREMIVNLTNMLEPNEPELAGSFRKRMANELS